MSGEDELRVISGFPGRLRVRARKFHLEPAVAEAVVQRLSGEPGVLSASASALTGSLLVLYDPHKTQIDSLLSVALSASGLSRVAADAQDHAYGTAAATRVASTFLRADTRLLQAFNGKLDLRTAVPGTLLLGGVATLLLKSFSRPQWYDLVFWSYVTFNNMNLVNRGLRAHEP